MSKRLPQLLVALVAMFGIIAVVIAVRPGSDEPSSDPTTTNAPPTDGGGPPVTAQVPQRSPAEEADAAAVDFLERYVEDDGRVHRVPEDDTVSEGQAYAMLLAVATDDAATFDAVWTWTKTNLLRRDGTLAWQWDDGVIVDPNAATDADLDAGRALLLAADRFAEPSYRTDGLALGTAILDHGVIDTAKGPVLVAGPWATTAPHYMNPSYMSDVAFELFAAARGDARWQQLADTSNVLLDELTQGGTLLPSDWALVDTDGYVTPSAPPGGEIAAYGYDAFRTVPRLAEACDETSRALAASMAPATGRTLDEPSSTANLDGSALSDGDNQLYRLAAAAGATAAGDRDTADALLDEADRVNAGSPTYYLGAWVALSRVLLDTDVLGGCAAGTTATAASAAPVATPTTTGT